MRPDELYTCKDGGKPPCAARELTGEEYEEFHDQEDPIYITEIEAQVLAEATEAANRKGLEGPTYPKPTTAEEKKAWRPAKRFVHPSLPPNYEDGAFPPQRIGGPECMAYPYTDTHPNRPTPDGPADAGAISQGDASEVQAADKPVDAAEQPVEVTGDSVEVDVEVAVEVAEKPKEVAEKPVEVAEKPAWTRPGHCQVLDAVFPGNNKAVECSPPLGAKLMVRDVVYPPLAADYEKNAFPPMEIGGSLFDTDPNRLPPGVAFGTIPVKVIERDVPLAGSGDIGVLGLTGILCACLGVCLMLVVVGRYLTVGLPCGLKRRKHKKVKKVRHFGAAEDDCEAQHSGKCISR